jgi:molybdate transport system substrate-binding protein
VGKVSLAAAAILMAHGVAVHAAEIKVVCPPGLKPVMQELGPQFQRATGHTLLITYQLSNVARPKIEAGETFDVAILLSSVIDDLAKQNKIVAVTPADVMRAGMGVAVRSGASQPDINSIESFKRALLDARSITYTKEAATGIYFEGLIERLGVAEEVKPKTTLAIPGTSAQLVAAGEAAMAITLISEILAARGAELVGPLPRELQYYVAFKAGVARNAEQPEASKEFIKFLTGPTASPIIKAKGVESD